MTDGSSSNTSLAVVGAGGIGTTSHLPAVRGLPDLANLDAVVERDQVRLEQAVRSFGGAPYTDLDTMLAEIEPELVLVASPPFTHTDIVLRCLEAGAWVLCEKPLVGSLRDADAIIAAERKTGAWCVTVSQFRYAQGARQVRDELRAGAHGRPLFGLAHTLWYREAAYWDIGWRGDLATEFGGAATTQGYHATDLLLWLMDPWVEVSAYVGTLARPIAVEDLAVGMVRFEGGALGSLVGSVHSRRERTIVAVHTTEASVELHTVYAPGPGDWARVPEVDEQWPAVDPRRADEPPHQTQLRHVLEHRRTGERPELTTEESRMTIEFLTALYKSSAVGRPVRAGEVVEGDPWFQAMHGDVAVGVGGPS